MSDDFYISAASRKALMGLQDTTTNLFKVNSRLNSGLKVESVSDDPVAFFKARGINTRADTFTERKDDIDQALSSMDATLDGVDAMQKLLLQMKGMLSNMKSSSTSDEFSGYIDSVGELMDQYDKLAEDATYNGVNLVSGTDATLDVPFGANRDHKVSISGVHLLSTRPDVKSLKDDAYHPLEDDTLLQQLRVMTDIAELTSVKGYTRLLGFGFTLFSVAKERYGFGNRVDKYVDAIGGTKVGTRQNGIFNESSLDLLNLAMAVPSQGLVNIKSYLDTAHNANLNNALALLRLGSTDFGNPTGQSFVLYKNRDGIAAFLSHLVEPDQTRNNLKLNFQDKAVVDLAENGYRQNFGEWAAGDKLHEFISLLYDPADILENGSRIPAFEAIINMFTYATKAELPIDDLRFLSGMRKNLSLIRDGKFPDLFGVESQFFSVVNWTNDALYQRYDRLWKMLAIDGRSQNSMMPFSSVDGDMILDFVHQFHEATAQTPVEVDKSVFSLIRRAGLLDVPIEQVLTYDDVNPLRNPDLIAAALNKQVGLATKGTGMIRRSLISAQINQMISAYASAHASVAIGGWSEATFLTAFIKNLFVTAASQKAIINKSLAAAMADYFSEALVGGIPSHGVLSPLGAGVARYFQRKAFFFSINTKNSAWKNWKDTDLKLIKTFLKDFGDQYFNKPVVINSEFNLNTQWYRQQELDLGEIFKDLKRRPDASLNLDDGDEIRHSLIGEGTTAMRKGLDWLKNVDFDDVYKAGELAKEVQVAVDNLSAASDYLDHQISRFGSLVDLLEIRLDFTESYVQHLEMGAGKLVLADSNTEGAKMMTLQTRQQMAYKALSIAGSQESNVVNLLR